MKKPFKQQTLIMASASPRRTDIAKANGYTPIILPPKVDETLPLNISNEQKVMFLALKKALAVEAEILGSPFAGKAFSTIEGFWEPPILIAADTLVFLGQETIEKPKDKEDAFRIISMLRNTTHTVITGVAMILAGQPNRRVFYDEAHVSFGDYSDKEILEYIETEEPYDKAGAYAIQGTWGRHATKVEGSIDTIIGLPWERIEEEYIRL